MLNRRELLAAVPLTFTMADVVVGRTPRPLAYRWRFHRALRIQLRQRKITLKQYRRYLRASWSDRFMNRFADEIVKTAKVAGDWVDDLQVWLGKLVSWLIENWEMVLRILFTLLAFV